MSKSKEALNRHVLVLNKHWRVIGATTVKDAIILMCRESALGVCTKTFQTYTWELWISGENPPITDFYVKSASVDVPAPEAVILIHYDDVYQHHVAFTVINLYRRDQYTCQYCGKKKSEEDLSVDHITPRSKGGRSNWLNCVLACLPCNHKKSDLTLTEAGMILIRQPFIPTWNPVINVRPDNRPKSWEHFVKKEWLDADYGI